MDTLLSSLFSPFRIHDLTLPNRVVMAPMTRGFSPGGVPTADVAAYYRRRAEGGVGLIVTEGTGVDRPAALNSASYPNFHGDAALAGWKAVVDAVHAAGGRIAPQLWHEGGSKGPERLGRGHRGPAGAAAPRRVRPRGRGPCAAAGPPLAAQDPRGPQRRTARLRLGQPQGAALTH